ncbi:MAG: MBL fold metallo-hydrolase [Ectothiorhodospiraceae bacterium]
MESAEEWGDAVSTVAQSVPRIADLMGERSGPLLVTGPPGSGKSTLASRCMDALGAEALALSADPGVPAFGPPGAVAVGRRRRGEWLTVDLEGLCTLDAARFRLPLLDAVSALLDRATGEVRVVDAPGVVRGIAAAELLEGLARRVQPVALVVLCAGGRVPLAAEIDALAIPVFHVRPDDAAHGPTRLQRARARTRSWEAWLAGAVVETLPAETPVLGTPPPLTVPGAWAGRQVALTADGRTVGLGEVASLDGERLTVRVSTPGVPPTAAVVRDAVRNRAGELATARRPKDASSRTAPPDMRPFAAGEHALGPVPVVRVGSAFATVINGVLGDPLLHVRLRHRRRSLLFDLGDLGRLPARIAHQVSDVFISHAHFDHIGGFLWLLRSRIGEPRVCRVYGPPGLADHVHGMMRGVLWDRIGDRGPVFEVAELHGQRLCWTRLQAGIEPAQSLGAETVSDGVLVSDPEFRVRALELDHGTPVLAFALEQPRRIGIRKERLARYGWPPGRWLGELKEALLGDRADTEIVLPDGSRESAGRLGEMLTLTTPGMRLVYATDLADTGVNRRRLIAFASGAHTLVCEASFRGIHADQAGRTGHLTARACGEIAAAAGVHQLVPFHFSRRYERDPEAVYAEVGAVFSAIVQPSQ